MIVLDALLSAMADRDLMKQGVVRSLLESLSSHAQELEIAVIEVAHFHKAAGTDPRFRSLATSAGRYPNRSAGRPLWTFMMSAKQG
jgi:hypothetical protein